jgi:membrane-bound metal-dependent hydrolase YbcI (DUF457 family)
VPLWLLLVAAQLVDIFWGVFIITGIEHASLDGTLASNPLVLQHMPYTHSLVATVVWSVIAMLIAQKAMGLSARDSSVVALVVASHWFLDLIVHRPDLPLLSGEPKLGLGLWNFPHAAYGLEVFLMLVAVWFCVKVIPIRTDRRSVWYGFALVLLIIQTMTSFGPIPSTLTAMVAYVMTIYLVIPFIGRSVERHQRRANY